MLTVDTAPTSTQLTTLATVKDELGIAENDTSRDDRLNRLINQASAAVVSFVARPLAQQSVTEIFGLGGGARETLVLSLLPVTAVAAVTEDGTPLIAGVDFRINATSGILHRFLARGLPEMMGDDFDPAPFLSRWHWCGGSIAVSYTAGFALPDAENPTLPADIERACLDTVRALWFGIGRDPMLRSDATQGVGSTAYAASTPGAGPLPPSAAEALVSYQTRGP